jgi:hypothetical protein
MKVLFVHGVGHMDDNLWWQEVWVNAVEKAMGPGSKITPQFMSYDSLFEENGAPSGRDYLKALLSLLVCRKEKSWHVRSHKPIGDKPLKNQIRWRVGMVAEFLIDEEMKQKWRKQFHGLLKDFQPDVVYAHSLGTLLTYDYLMHPDYKTEQQRWVYVTAASQLYHDRLDHVFKRPLEMPMVKRWINLNNPHDMVLAENQLVVRMDAQRTFEQHVVPWEATILFNHDEPGYIIQTSQSTDVWRRMPMLVKM